MPGLVLTTRKAAPGRDIHRRTAEGEMKKRLSVLVALVAALGLSPAVYGGDDDDSDRGSSGPKREEES